ncbi:MAG TPA: hypothetical protein DEA08_26760 [Planctomycetes bacterium]|nr:hypothetical protein [Planctomycetota bacterium]
MEAPPPQAAPAKSKSKKAPAGPRRSISERRAPATKQSKTGLYVGLGAVGLLLVGGLAFTFLGGGGGGGEGDVAASPTPRESASPAPSASADPSPAGPAPRPSSSKAPAPQGDPLAKLFAKPKAPLTNEAKEERAADAAEDPLSRAWDLADVGKFDEAVALLSNLRKRWPEWLEGTEPHGQVKAKLTEFRRKRALTRRLKEALAAGPTSPEIKRWVARIEGKRLPPELASLACVKEFQQKAENLMGLEAYRAIEMEQIDLGDLEADLAEEGDE